MPGTVVVMLGYTTPRDAIDVWADPAGGAYAVEQLTDPGLIHPGVLLELPPTSDPSTDQQ